MIDHSKRKTKKPVQPQEGRKRETNDTRLSCPAPTTHLTERFKDIEHRLAGSLKMNPPPTAYKNLISNSATG